MKVAIPDNLTGKELHKFLVANKSALINEKKSIIRHADSIECKRGHGFEVTEKVTSEKSAIKSGDTVPASTGVVHVKVVANACNWMDSQSDVLLNDSSKKTISERKGSMVHLHDHIYRLDAQIGDVTDVYLEDIPLKELGLNKSGKTQCIIFETDVKESYNEMVYNLYKSGKVAQHSIGLQYVKMGLAINDEEEMAEYELWDKYIAVVINKDEAIAQGYFWVIQEIKLLENSSVLFGSNRLTPTLSESQPSSGTGKSQPLQSTDENAEDESQTKSRTPVIACPDCDYFFIASAEDPQKCPNCGYFVSPNSTTVMLSDEPFDWKAAIENLIF